MLFGCLPDSGQGKCVMVVGGTNLLVSLPVLRVLVIDFRYCLMNPMTLDTNCTKKKCVVFYKADLS